MAALITSPILLLVASKFLRLAIADSTAFLYESAATPLGIIFPLKYNRKHFFLIIVKKHIKLMWQNVAKFWNRKDWQMSLYGNRNEENGVVQLQKSSTDSPHTAVIN